MRGDEGWRTTGGTARRDWRLDGLGPASLEVDMTRGARISRLRVAGRDVLVDARPGPSPFQDGIFLMAPYAGRVRDARFGWAGAVTRLPANVSPHSAHGVVADAAWESPAPGTFRTSLDARWPLGGWASIAISPRPAGVRLEARLGAASRSMPTNAGWHPWFRRHLDGAEGSLDWSPSRVYRDDEGITSRTLVARDAHLRTWTAPVGDADPVLRWPGVLDLRLSSAAARCWVVHETADAICVEPQTAPGDALNAGDGVIVAPGESSTIDLELAFTAAGSGSDAVRGPARPAAPRTPDLPSRRDRIVPS